MTIAVCFNCGEIKWGAFNACQKCHARPTTDDELTTSLLFTDHYYDQETLAKVSEEIRNGVKFNIDDATRSTLTPAIQEFKRTVGSDLGATHLHTGRSKRQWKLVGKLRFFLYNVTTTVVYVIVLELVTRAVFRIITAIQGNYTNVFHAILQGNYVGIQPLLWSIGQLIFAVLVGNGAALTMSDWIFKRSSQRFVASGIFVLIGIGVLVMISIGVLRGIYRITSNEFNVSLLYYLINAATSVVFVWRFIWRGKSLKI